MKRVKVDNQLVKFLKDEGVWDKFVENVKRDEDYIDGQLVEISRIGEAFTWIKSNEGQTYWMELSDKYCEVCKG